MPLKYDLSGKRFGRLLVLRRFPISYKNEPDWLCRCDCGVEKMIRSGTLRAGLALSCGCSQIVLKHGHSKDRIRSRTYLSWQSMLQRCFDSNHKSYKEYGGAGITVCEQWQNFAIFLNDMGIRPIGTTLDRIDNGKGYTPDNCRWASYKGQSRNRRISLYAEHGGRHIYLKEIAERTGVLYQTIWRWHKQGKLGEKIELVN